MKSQLIQKTLPKWVKSWCCQAVAKRFLAGGDWYDGVFSDLRCSACGKVLFDDLATQKLIVEGEPYDSTETVPNPFYKEAWARKKKA